MSLDGGTGEISGTANVAGTSGFVVRATDSNSDTVTKALSLDVLAAAAATVAFDVQPTDVAAGGTITPAVQVKVADALGNGVAGESVSLALLGTGTLTGGDATVTDANGIATFTSLSVDLAGSKQLEATSGALAPDTSATFNVTAGAAATVAFDVQPTDVAAGGTITPAVQVKVADALGNGVAGESVSLALLGTGTLTGGGSTLTDANGIATFASLSVDVAGAKQLEATSGVLAPDTSAVFNVTAGGAVAIAFTVEPTDVVAGASIAPAVEVKVSDALGNGVAGESVTLALVGSGVLTGGGAVLTDANGIATFAALSVDLVGAKQLEATSGALAPATSASFNVTAAAAATVAFDVQPTDVAAGGTITPAVQVKVADTFGNAVAGESVGLALLGAGTLTGGDATVTDANGIATFAGLSVDVAGAKQLEATSGALAPDTSAVFNVTAGTAVAIAFMVEPTDVVAGASIAPAVEVKVSDALGNGIAGESVTLALVGSGVLTGGGAVLTDANGIATFAALSVDLVGAKQLEATSGVLTPATSASFNVTAAAAATLTFDVEPTDVVAGASITPAVQVHARDAFGNDVPGADVGLSLVGTGTLTGGDPTATDAGGIATFAGLSVNLVGSKQLSATSGSATPANSASFTVTPDAAAALTFDVQPTDAVAGATLAPAVQVKVADAFGNGVPGESVALTLVGAGTLTGGGAVLTDASGIATFAGLSVDLVGSKQLSATSGLLGPVLSASFAVTCPVISLAPPTLPSGSVGVAYSQTIMASGGLAPYSFAVTTGAVPSGLTLGPDGLLSGTPDTNGQFDFTVTATDANGCSGALAYSVVVCGTVAVSPVTLPDAQQGAPYSQSLTATGGVAPYAFAVTAGALPSGLALSPEGLVSGTPTAVGTFLFTVTATSAGGCIGSTELSLTVPGVPSAAIDLDVNRQATGNDGDGTGLMLVSFTPSAFTSTVEVYRAPFGGYPQYDDAGGSTPPTPSYPPGSPWVLTAVTASGQADDPPVRDAWSYVVFFKNSVGQVSSVSNKTPSRPNYALGDVSNGITPGDGDNLVDDLDISLLGANYGISGSQLTTAGVHYLDVGPTTDFAVTSRPFTDDRLDFEDLIVFATNYGAVSGPASVVAAADAAARAANGSERLTLHAPSLVEAGQTFDVVLDLTAAGRLQGLSAELTWDASVVEPVGMTSAGWVEGQKGVVWSSRPGVVDAALLGARAKGLVGSGTLARWTFRARRVGDPRVELGAVSGRDAANRPLSAASLLAGTEAAPPSRTLLFAPWPNPASGPATVAFALAQAGDVDLAIYSVDGRRIRSLASGPLSPGSYRFTWSGDDEQRRAVAPGVYYVQMVAQGRRFSRSIVHLR